MKTTHDEAQDEFLLQLSRSEFLLLYSLLSEVLDGPTAISDDDWQERIVGSKPAAEVMLDDMSTALPD